MREALGNRAKEIARVCMTTSFKGTCILANSLTYFQLLGQDLSCHPLLPVEIQQIAALLAIAFLETLSSLLLEPLLDLP